jgi:hypothetical protein
LESMKIRSRPTYDKPARDGGRFRRAEENADRYGARVGTGIR